MFPTTLRDIAPQGGVIHIYAELRGRRYHCGAAINTAEARALVAEYQAAYPRAAIYSKDRSDSTQVDGGPAELADAAR